jgi:type II secretory pathway predicted ATPase ExeA
MPHDVLFAPTALDFTIISLYVINKTFQLMLWLGPHNRRVAVFSYGGTGTDKMYKRFFGFSKNPFRVTADPVFLYLNAGLREMLAALISGIRNRCGLMAIVGDSGTGKTTLLNAAMSRLDEKTKVARISNAKFSFEEMLTMALVDLGLADPLKLLSVTEAWHRLHEFATRQQEKGGNVVFLVDEAQNLDALCIKKFQRLFKPTADQPPLIQVVLFGLPEDNGKLHRSPMGWLRTGVSTRWQIAPLNKHDTYAYIQHRLKVAGYKGPALFTRKALRLIWNESYGVPRIINTLCETSLLMGYIKGNREIKASAIKRVIAETSWKPCSRISCGPARMAVEQRPLQSTGKISYARFALVASLMFAVSLAVLTGLLVADSRLKVKSEAFRYRYKISQLEKPTQSDGVIQSASADRQPSVLARASMSQGVWTTGTSANDVQPAAHLTWRVEGGKLPVQVVFLPVDHERAPPVVRDSCLDQVPLKCETTHGEVCDVKPGMAKAVNPGDSGGGLPGKAHR